MRLLYATNHQADAYLLKALREAGHLVEGAGELADGLQMAAEAEYQAIILDWKAPPVTCAPRFAAAAGPALLLVVIGSGDEADRAAVLGAGADACFVRPLSFIELEARLEALARLVRRVHPAGDAVAIELVAAGQAARLNGRTVSLSARELHLLKYLLAHAGEVISLDRLGRHLWGDEADPRPELIRTQVSRLRRKLGGAGGGAVLRNVAGHGYVLEPGLLEPLTLQTGAWDTEAKIKNSSSG